MIKSKYSAAITDKPWWLAGGIPREACVAAYQPVGASDYAASKVNLENPGVNNAVDGATVPTWDSINGWIFGSNKYMVLPAWKIHYSIICKYSNITGSGSAVLLGFLNAGGAAGMYCQPLRTGNTFSTLNGNNSGSYGVSSGNKPAGVVAIAGLNGYFNGVDTLCVNVSATLTELNVHVGRLNFNPTLPITTGYVQAIAMYRETLNPSQVAALTNAMNAL